MKHLVVAQFLIAYLGICSKFTRI